MIALLSILVSSAQEVADETFEPIPPPPAHVPALKAPVIWSVDDATTAVLVEDHRAPLVELRIQLPAGSWTPWLIDNHGEEAWTHQHYDPDGTLRARADALAADLGFSVRQQRSLLSVSCLKRDLPEALTLVADILANDAFDSEELKRTDKSMGIGWESSLKDPDFRTKQAAHRLLFADGDPRRIPYEESDDIATDSAELAAARDAMLRLPGRVIGFGGDFTRAEVDALVGDILPAATAAPEGLSPVFLPLNTLPEDTIEAMDNLTQTYFAWFRAGPDWDATDYAAWRVADHVLGGHFFSRLYVALRHDGGETYGARTQGSGAAQPEVYGIGTFTRLENTATTEEKLRATLATFHADGITADELAGSVGYFSGSRLMDRQSPGQVLGEVMWDLGNARPVGWADQLNTATEALSVEQVNAAITAHFAPADFTMLKVTVEE
ncbi:MAG: zinc protease [Myxococcota bacterium]|jgi:zinc protease